MNINYTLKYRTFDSLLEDVRVDLRSFALEGKIEPQQLIKIALKCNYDLGLRIQMIKHKVLDIHTGKARLPEDFTVMNYALICGSFTETRINPQGTTIEEVPIKDILPTYKDPIEPNPCTDTIINPCTPTLTPNTTTPICLSRCSDGCGNATGGFQLVQRIHTTTRHYSYMHQVRFINSKGVCPNSPNLHWMCRDQAFIRDGFIWFHDHNSNNHDHNNHHNTNHNHRNDMHGHLYINYEGALEDDDGNVLVPDHPFLNEYYEYALKKRILENLIMDGEENIDKPYQLVIQELRAARNNALTVVNTPNFSEMQRLHDTVRKAYQSRYYDMFKSHDPSWSTRFLENNVV